VTSDGFYNRFDLTSSVDHSFGIDDTDVGFVANIDGNVVGLTPFRQTVIPPPLNAFELRFQNKVSEVKKLFLFHLYTIMKIRKR
jgi:elongator complex protein 1